MELALQDFLRELMSFRNMVKEAAGVANEGWKLLNDTIDESGKPPGQYPPGQTSPF